MAAIMGFSQLILRRDLDETVRRDQERILHEATRAAKIISDLQSFARGHMPRREHVDVVQVIRRVLEFRAYSFQVDNIRTVTRFSADAAFTLGDEHRLDQLFLNLVVNAQQFMRDAHGSGTLSVDLSKSPEWISVSVTDDGPGIATDDLPKVFDPFFTTKEVGKGTGLGLSMCYGIVREHGGTIAAHSGPGKGATLPSSCPHMLGDKVGESQGKVTGRRVLPSDGGGPRVEVSFAEAGKILGLDVHVLVTYNSQIQQDGSLFGEGQGMIMASNGEGASFVGTGAGRFTETGGTSFRGALYFQSSGATLSRLNGGAVVFENETGADDSTKTGLWEWK